MFKYLTVLAVMRLVIGKQYPVPHPPFDPVVYPEDYCANPNASLAFDFVIVGAGPAGATLGRRLAEDPSVRVLILEAGGNPPPTSDIPTRILRNPVLWNVTTVYKKSQCQGYIGNVCHYALAKYVGGCSINNGMMYVRGNREDYEEWERSGCPGWGYRDMLYYFLKLENFQDPSRALFPDPGYHSEGGPFTTSPTPDDPLTFQFLQGYNQALRNMYIRENFDPNGRIQTGFGTITASTEITGYRGNVAKAYLLDLPENLKICQYSTVQKLRVKPVLDLYTVTGVEFVYNGTVGKGARVATAKKDYILTAGPVNTPQILERSGIGRREVLERAGVRQIFELSGVGENLQEQFSNSACAFSLNLKNSVAQDPLSISTFMHALFLNLTDPLSMIPDTQWIYSSLSGLDLSTIAKPEIYQQFEKLTKQNRHVLLMGSVILRQSNPGYVHIAGTNPNHSPLFQPNQYTTHQETRLLGMGCRLIRRALSDKILAKFDPKPIVLDQCKKFVFSSDEEIKCGAIYLGYPLYHLAGSAKMGPFSDSNAVVDPRLRVYNVDNLRVCDLSVMPKVPRGNTQVPTIAVAEKAADIIKQDWQQPRYNFMQNMWGL